MSSSSVNLYTVKQIIFLNRGKFLSDSGKGQTEGKVRGRGGKSDKAAR